MPTLLDRLRTTYTMGVTHGTLDLVGDEFRTSFDLDDDDIHTLIDSATLAKTKAATAAQWEAKCAELQAQVGALGKDLAFAREQAGLADADRESWRKVAGERLDRVEVEKAAHGETHKALMNTIADRSRAQRDRTDAEAALTKANDRATKAEARVAELEAGGEPFVWAIRYQDAVGYGINEADAREKAARYSGTVEPLYLHPPKPTATEPVAWRVDHGPDDWALTASGEVAARAKNRDAKVTPLYEAPPPAAIGVEGEQHFVIADVERRDVGAVCLADEDNDIHNYTGTRAEVEAAISEDDDRDRKWAAYRLLPLDAPTVDVAEVRAIASGLVKEHFCDAASRLRAAIGDR